MALCDPIRIQDRTKFPLPIVRDWKDQAVLYILTSDLIIENNSERKKDHQSLYDILNKNLGIRTYTGLKTLQEAMKNESAEKKESDFSILKGLNLMHNGKADFNWFNLLFTNLATQGETYFGNATVASQPMSKTS
jgi:hypothetical protein